MAMFNKILVANRGEIAVRIMQTCDRMGIDTVAVYSETDSRALHVRRAREAVSLEGTTAAQSYLDMEKVIEIALQSGCQAIHPGYGFLSENPRFAQMVTEAGLKFIGPPASAMALLGDKVAAKQLAESAGIRVVAGHPEPIAEVTLAREYARKIGYPVLIKPAAGGGGKGMRIVGDDSEIEASLAVCSKEALRAFGDDRVFVEQYIANPRHIEIQIMADEFGNVIHLGERECSIQRRYQKIIEEAPSVAVEPELRQEMGQLACRLAEMAGYVNAGTVEFLLDEQGHYYFLEMNTRLQVEHPVTEMVTGLDLVELQIRIACGERLSLSQEDVNLTGWAIEARICAEDPSRDFFPATGLITRYSEPRGGHLRVDAGVEEGSLVSMYFDSLLAKVIAWGEDRERACSHLVGALNGYHIEGVVTNRNFVNRILNLSEFRQGALSTNFIEENFDGDRAKEEPPREHLQYAALAAAVIHHGRNTLLRGSLKPMISAIGSTTKPDEKNRYIIKYDGAIFDLYLSQQGQTWTAQLDGTSHTIIVPPFEFYRRRLKLEIDGRTHRFILEYRGSFIECSYCGIREVFEIYSPREWELASFIPAPEAREVDNLVRSPMPGLVLEVKVEAGDRVQRGQDLIVIESMKMESCISSPSDGVISELPVHPGQTVEAGDILVRFE